MNKLDKDYQLLLQDILDNGITKTDRTGTGTISVFGRQIRHKMSDGFPLLTTKKMAFKTMVTELLWFLRGDTNIKYLVDNNCHIWDGDCFSNYQKQMDKIMMNSLPYIKGFDTGIIDDKTDYFWNYDDFINKIKTDDEFANKWGELGSIYGKQWRSWSTYEETSWGIQRVVVDQIANSINLLKTDPDSRRNRVNAWNVGELDQMVLPPCHTDFQFFTRELSGIERLELFGKLHPGKQLSDFAPGGMEVQSVRHQRESRLNWANVPTRAISLMWNQRSVDTFLGLPFNIASYGLLLEIIAKAVNMVPDELIGNLGDTHLYSNHIEQAKEQIGREPYSLPILKHMKTDDFYKSLSENLSLITHLDNTDFVIENYQSHSSIKAPLSN
jgi:thymidylate synthase